MFEFDASNWDVPQDVVVTAVQDDLAEVGVVSVVVGFEVESPEQTHGLEDASNASSVLAELELASAAQNGSRLESLVGAGFDVLVEDDESASVSLTVVSTDVHGTHVGLVVPGLLGA